MFSPFSTCLWCELNAVVDTQQCVCSVARDGVVWVGRKSTSSDLRCSLFLPPRADATRQKTVCCSSLLVGSCSFHSFSDLFDSGDVGRSRLMKFSPAHPLQITPRPKTPANGAKKNIRDGFNSTTTRQARFLSRGACRQELKNQRTGRGPSTPSRKWRCVRPPAVNHHCT